MNTLKTIEQTGTTTSKRARRAQKGTDPTQTVPGVSPAIVQQMEAAATPVNALVLESKAFPGLVKPRGVEWADFALLQLERSDSDLGQLLAPREPGDALCVLAELAIKDARGFGLNLQFQAAATAAYNARNNVYLAVYREEEAALRADLAVIASDAFSEKIVRAADAALIKAAGDAIKYRLRAVKLLRQTAASVRFAAIAAKERIERAKRSGGSTAVRFQPPTPGEGQERFQNRDKSSPKHGRRGPGRHSNRNY